MSAVDDFVALVDGWLGENERERIKIQQLRAAALAIAAGDAPPAPGATGALSDVVADLVSLRTQLLALVERIETAPARREPRQNGAKAQETPRQTPSSVSVAAAPGRAGPRRTDDEIRALCSDLKAGALQGQLMAKGVPRGGTWAVVERARQLGVLPPRDKPVENIPKSMTVAPAAAKPGKGRHRTDDEIRQLCAGLDPARSYYSQLTERGVPNGSIDKVINKGRALGVLARRLDVVASPAQNGDGPTPEPSEGGRALSGNGSAPAADAYDLVTLYTDDNVRELWEALDPNIDVRSQLTDAGVPQRDQGYIRTRARHLAVDMLGGEPTKTKSWAVQNSPLKEPAVAKGPSRSSLKLVLGCTTCDHVADTAGAMEIHTRETHGRPSTKQERTPLTPAQAAERGVNA